MESRYPLHRPELDDALLTGERAIVQAMASHAVTLKAGQPVIQAGFAHDKVYRVRAGWLSRSRTTRDGRRQIIDFALAGDLVGVKSMLLAKHRHDVDCVT